MADFEINGVKLEIDLLDADNLEVYQNAIERADARIKDKNEFEGLTEVQHMRQQCRVIDEFFDTVFGEGTAVELFGGGNNLGKRLEAFGEVITCANESQAKVQEVTSKYNPQRLNREQRRAQEFGKVRKMPETVAGRSGRPVQRSSNVLPGNVQLTAEQIAQIAQIAAIINYGAVE